MLDQTYHIKLAEALRGRKLRVGVPTQLSFLGSETGISPGDIHCERLYQLWLDLDGARRITAVAVAVTGELISPCSGYAQESLDEFDYPNIRNHCISLTE